MSLTEILNELPRLQPEERARVLDKVFEIDGAWMDGGELTPEEKHLLESRLAEHDQNPGAGVPWEEVKARLLAKFPG